MSGGDVMDRWPGEAEGRVEHIGLLLGQWQYYSDRASAAWSPKRAIGAGNEAIERIDALIADAKRLRAEVVKQVEEYGESA